MEKEKSNPYTFFILRYRLMNLQGGIFAFEKEKNYGIRKNRKKNRKTKSLQFSYNSATIQLQFTNNVTNVTNVTKIKLIKH